MIESKFNGNSFNKQCAAVKFCFLFGKNVVKAVLLLKTVYQDMEKHKYISILFNLKMGHFD